jgi:DNA-binding winged helix-turn-helix (wHTH) protein/tetratricopeptide (TPR) repeat protein
MSAKRLFVFDEYRLDEQERQLLRGGEPVQLPPKLFDLLAELVRNARRLLDKQDLLDRLWADIAVEEGSLTRGISSLRRALGRTADGRDFIQTVSKRGYRFVADVRQEVGEIDAVGGATGIPPPPAILATHRVEFVGREAELPQIVDVWHQALQGRRRMLLIAGEPGIGKTRLALEFARARAAEGATILIGSCDEENLVAYQPFVESLTWYVRHCPEAELRSQLAAVGGGAELATLVPAVRTRIPELPRSSPVDAEAQRYQLFETVCALLAAASRARPLLLVFDDLHWADKPTLLLVRHLVRSARTAGLCIVATYRGSEVGQTHPLSEILAGLRREPAVARLVLRGFDVTHLTGLVESIIGPDAPAELARIILDATDGNPLFATEMLLHLKEIGAISGRPHGGIRNAVDVVDLGLSESIRELIGRRLSRLSDAANRALSAAAVIGREFDVTLLEGVCDLSEAELLDGLDEAARAQLVGESRKLGGRFEFTHALIRRTVYSELSSARRMKLHRRVADALERSTGRNPPLAELAYHFFQGAHAGDVDKAIAYAMQAGDRAAEGLAHEEGARLFEMALHALEYKTDGRDLSRLRLEIHTRRARCFEALGQWTPAVRELEAALGQLDASQIERRCELLLALARASFLLLDVRPVEGYATEALLLAEHLHRQDFAANAIAWLARCRQADGDLGAAIDMDRRAISRATGSATAAHMLGPLTLYLAGRSSEAIPLAVAAADAALASGDTTFIMYALTHVGLNMTATGRYREASNAFEEARRFGRKYGALPMLARATAMAAGLHLNLFDFEGAEALQCEARDLARSAGFAPPIVSAGIDSLLTLARRHEPGPVERLLDETAAAAANTAGWHQWLWQLRLSQARAELSFARGAFDDASSQATRAIEQCVARGRPKYESLGLVTRARAWYALGRNRDAIADAKAAVDVAERTCDPAVLLLALDALLELEGTDDVADRARGVMRRMDAELPDEVMRRSFRESDVVRRIRRTLPHSDHP